MLQTAEHLQLSWRNWHASVLRRIVQFCVLAPAGQSSYPPGRAADWTPETGY